MVWFQQYPVPPDYHVCALGYNKLRFCVAIQQKILKFEWFSVLLVHSRMRGLFYQPFAMYFWRDWIHAQIHCWKRAWKCNLTYSNKLETIRVLTRITSNSGKYDLLTRILLELFLIRVLEFVLTRINFWKIATSSICIQGDRKVLRTFFEGL